jgi:hypothetical protein
LTLADLPDVDRELWVQQVGDLLNELIAERGFDHIGAANVDAGGIVRFHGVSAHVTSDEIRTWISTGERRYRLTASERQQCFLPTGFAGELRKGP